MHVRKFLSANILSFVKKKKFPVKLRIMFKYRGDLFMTMKALSFRTDEKQIADIKKAASMFQMSVAGLIREAVREYIDSRKTAQQRKEEFFRRLENVEEASPEESAEILAMIDSMTEDDMQVVRVDHILC